MVAINEILVENVGAFELDTGDIAKWKGITAKWAGNTFVVTNISPQAKKEFPGIRKGPIPKQYRGGFVNAARTAEGMPRLDFDGGGNLRSGTVPASAGSKDPIIQKPDTSGTPIGRYEPRADVAKMDPDELMTKKEMNLRRKERRDLRRGIPVKRNGVYFTQDDIDQMEGRLKTLRSRRAERNADNDPKKRLQAMKNQDVGKKQIFQPRGPFGKLVGILGLASIPAYEELRNKLRDERAKLFLVTQEINKKYNAGEIDFAESQRLKNEELTASQKYELRIFATQTVPIMLVLTNAAITSTKAMYALVRYVRAVGAAVIFGAGAVGLGPGLLGAALVNIAIFVLTELLIYMGVKWLMNTEAGKKATMTVLSWMWIDITVKFLAPVSMLTHDVIEGHITRELMDMYRENISAPVVKKATDMVDDMIKVDADRIDRTTIDAWNNINSADVTIGSDQDSDVLPPKDQNNQNPSSINFD